MKIITAEWLRSKDACKEGTDWVTKRMMCGLPANEFAQKLYDGKRYDWMNWLFVRMFNKEQLKKYTCYAMDLWAEYVAEKYPNDTDSKPLIEKIQAAVRNPSEKNLEALNEARKNYRADRAYLAYLAYRAYLADLAYRADRAYRAYLAYRAKMQKKMVEFGLTLID